MIVITGHVTVRPDGRDEAVRLALEHVARSRHEPGCHSHSVHADVENPDRLVFFEEWEDLDAVQTHFAVPASIEFVEAISALALEPPELDLFDARRVTL